MHTPRCRSTPEHYSPASRCSQSSGMAEPRLQTRLQADRARRPERSPRPLMTICQNSETPSITSPSARTPITNAPISDPVTDPRPPISEVPPSTTAAIAFNSKLSPVAGCADFQLRRDDETDQRRAELPRRHMSQASPAPRGCRPGAPRARCRQSHTRGARTASLSPQPTRSQTAPSSSRQEWERAAGNFARMREILCCRAPLRRRD